MSNFKVKFDEPININGREVKELEFREPIGEDMESLIGIIAEGVENTGEALTALASRCVVSHSLEEDDIRAMPAKAYLKIVSAFTPFLPQM
jgi:hypothetical protein